MSKFKKYLIPFIVILLLIGSIILNIIEINNPKTPFFQKNNTPSTAEKILTKTSNFDETLTVPINETSIEMKVNRAETSVVTIKDQLTGTTSNQIYFQVFATVKNIGAKSFSFSSTPVVGVSKNNFILLAKNVVSNNENKVVVSTDGISPNQNSNLMRSSLEIKPGAETSGFFLFENEVQTIQISSSNTPYIWKTMKLGAEITGKEVSSHAEITNKEKTVRFQILNSQFDTVQNKQLNIIRFSMTNSSNDEISPLSFIPKYGTSIPGEVYKSEIIDSEFAQRYNGEFLNSDSRLAPNQTKEYLVAFPKNVAFIFLQPPMTEDFSSIKIIL